MEAGTKKSKRPDVEIRNKLNKTKSFVSVKMKWKTFCKNDAIRDGIIPIIDNCNKIIYNSFHLANIHGGRGFIETHPGEIAQNLLIDGNIFLG
jgi:hypothetical protein